MGFHTGKHGKVYNDAKSSKGTIENPGNSDGSNKVIRDDDDDYWKYSNKFDWSSHTEKVNIMSTVMGINPEHVDTTGFEYSDFDEQQQETVNFLIDQQTDADRKFFSKKLGGMKERGEL